MDLNDGLAPQNIENTDIHAGQLVRADIHLKVGDKVHVQPYSFRSIGGEVPAEMQGLLDLSQRTRENPAGVGGDEARQYLSQRRGYFERNLLIERVEQTRINIGKLTKTFLEDAHIRHGYNVEVIRAKIITTSTGIPIHQKILEHEALGVLGEKNVDHKVPAYYYLETRKDGHNTVYLQDLHAGAYVMDMDGDEATLMVMRKRNRKGNVVDEFMIPYKEPLTQKTPAFRNVQYEKAVKFKKENLLGKFAGLNYGNDVKPEDILRQEVSSLKYSLSGDFLRAFRGDRSNFGGPRSLTLLREKIESKQLNDVMTGVTTNLYDTKSIYDTLQYTHQLKANNPELYKTLLVQQQQAASDWLEKMKSVGARDARLMDGQVFISHSRLKEQFNDSFEAFVSALAVGNPEENPLLEGVLQHNLIATRFLDDPKRIGEIEGGMKVSRSANVTGFSSEIASTFRKRLVDHIDYFKSNSITQLSPEQHNRYLEHIMGMSDSEIHRTFGAVFPGVEGNPRFDTLKETIATTMFKNNKESQINIIEPGETTFSRLNTTQINGHTPLVMYEVGGPGALFAPHLAHEQNYNENPVAIMLRDMNGDPLGPKTIKNGSLIAEGGLLGNIADENLNILNRKDYIATELERRLNVEFKGARGFGQTTDDLSFESVLKALRLGRSSGKARQILEAYGATGDQGYESSFLANLADKLAKAGPNSSLHRELTLKYDYTHRGYMEQIIQKHLSDVISQGGGTHNAALMFDAGGVTADETDIRFASSTVGIDLGYSSASLNRKGNAVERALSKLGGYVRKNTNQGKDRYIHMQLGSAPGSITPLGTSSHYYMSEDLARRSADIQRQARGGVRIKGLRTVMVDTDLNAAQIIGGINHEEDIRRLFHGYNVDAPIGAKRHDEGLILISRNARFRIGNTLDSREFNGAMEEYIQYHLGDRKIKAQGGKYRQLTGAEESGLRTRLESEFKSLYSLEHVGRTTQYKLNSEGMDSVISRVMKLGSYYGDKAMVMTVDSIMHNGRSADVLEHRNQATSRGNHIMKLQQSAESAVREGRIDRAAFGPLMDDMGNLRLDGAASKYADNENAFLEHINTHLIAPLRTLGEGSETRVTVNGTTQKFLGGLERTSDDWFATGNANDIFTNMSTPEINIRSISKTKLLGRISNTLDEELGGAVHGIGSQLLLAAMGEQAAKVVSARVIGQATAESMASAEVIAASKKLVQLGRSSAQGALDIFRDQAGI